jgi:hypothetical protein
MTASPGVHCGWCEARSGRLRRGDIRRSRARAATNPRREERRCGGGRQPVSLPGEIAAARCAELDGTRIVVTGGRIGDHGDGPDPTGGTDTESAVGAGSATVSCGQCPGRHRPPGWRTVGAPPDPGCRPTPSTVDTSGTGGPAATGPAGALRPAPTPASPVPTRIVAPAPGAAAAGTAATTSAAGPLHPGALTAPTPPGSAVPSPCWPPDPPDGTSTVPHPRAPDASARPRPREDPPASTGRPPRRFDAIPDRQVAPRRPSPLPRPSDTTRLRPRPELRSGRAEQAHPAPAPTGHRRHDLGRPTRLGFGLGRVETRLVKQPQPGVAARRRRHRWRAGARGPWRSRGRLGSAPRFR